MAKGEAWTPIEAAVVTGVSVASQQGWRRRGLLPQPGRKRASHRRYSLEDLCRLALLRSLRDVGLPLAQAKPVMETDLIRVLALTACAASEGIEKGAPSDEAALPGWYVAAVWRGEDGTWHCQVFSEAVYLARRFADLDAVAGLKLVNIGGMGARLARRIADVDRARAEGLRRWSIKLKLGPGSHFLTM